MHSNDLKAFFENRELVIIVDAIAKRYGLTPYQVLTEMSIDEFSIDVAVMVMAKFEEKKQTEEQPSGKKESFNSLGIDRTVVKGKNNG